MGILSVPLPFNIPNVDALNVPDMRRVAPVARAAPEIELLHPLRY
jgi:hypothetical protein